MAGFLNRFKRNKTQDDPRVSVRQIQRFNNDAFDADVNAIVERGIGSSDQAVQSYAAAFQHAALGQTLDCRDIWAHAKTIETTENGGEKDETLRGHINGIRADLKANLGFAEQMKAFGSKEDTDRLAYGKSLITDMMGYGRRPSITTINQLAARAGKASAAKKLYAEFAAAGIRPDAVSTTIMLGFYVREGNPVQAHKLIDQLDALPEGELDARGRQIIEAHKKTLAANATADAAE